MTFEAVKQKFGVQLKRFQLPEVSNWDLAVAVVLLCAWQLIANVGELIGLVPVLIITGIALLMSAASLRHVYFCPALRALGWTVPRTHFLLIAIISGSLTAFAVATVVRAFGIQMVRDPVTITVLAVTVGPIVEESFFRGFLQPWMAANAGALLGVVGAAFCFAAVHRPVSFLQISCFTFMGAAYGFLRLRSGSVLSSMLMHSSYNFAILLMSYPR
jgi:membrane protease YdiL (CAAX protease family)